MRSFIDEVSRMLILENETGTGFFFGENFDTEIKQKILNNLLRNPGSHCAGESIRWYAHLTEDLNVSPTEIDFCHGAYGIGENGIEHYWLQIKGVIFDPTAFQFRDYGIKTIEKKNYHLWDILENF